MNALFLFLPAEHGQYVCKPFGLSHYYPLFKHDSDVEGRLKRLRMAVDGLIACQFEPSGSVRPGEILQEEIVSSWRKVGYYGREFGAIACPTSLLDAENVADHVHGVLVRKQMDYGHENIRRFGRIGLIVRMQDKVARLENLIARGAAEDPQNESLFDNVVDVMGYSAIGLMWESETFLLPLKEKTQLEALPL